jgi:hypothetical protein
MKYAYFEELPQLVAGKMISARLHPTHPLTIFNYSVKSQMTPLAQWTQAMKDCRGLILDAEGMIVGRPFAKFWNLEQVSDQVPDGDFEVWEKLDGSLGIVCYYAGERIVSTRGSFESDQAIWFRRWLDLKYPDFTPSGETWLFEILFPENRIVVDYGDRKEGVLLSVMSPDGVDLPDLFHGCTRFRKARRFDGLKEFSAINSDPQFAGAEGFVVRWANGFRAKVKLDEYKRLHRLITQCSTRTIWELLRSGSGIQELVDRVPAEFKAWVEKTAAEIQKTHDKHSLFAAYEFANYGTGAPGAEFSRKDFAMWATKQQHPQLLFALLDGKPISDMCWKLAEPRWSTPFKKAEE